jgi:hypothetical protein
MRIITHKIAGITFRTEADAEVYALEDPQLQLFSTVEAPAQVHLHFCGIPSKSCSLPPLTSKERALISRCIFAPYVGSGIFRSTMVSLPGQEPFSSSNRAYTDVLNLPLLRAPVVRQRLAQCLAHPEQVGLLLHLRSIVLRDHRQSKVDFFYTAERAAMLRESTFKNDFRRMLTSFLPSFSAALVHSSAVVRQGKAALFLAPDGGGKTTVAEQAPPMMVIADDHVILRKEGPAIIVHSTPWGRLYNPHLSARVGAIFLLKKAPRFQLLPVPRTRALEHFWQEGYYDRVFLPPHLKQEAFQMLYETCCAAPVWEMEFTREGVNWQEIDAVMEQGLDGRERSKAPASAKQPRF